MVVMRLDDTWLDECGRGDLRQVTRSLSSHRALAALFSSSYAVLFSSSYASALLIELCQRSSHRAMPFSFLLILFSPCHADTLREVVRVQLFLRMIQDQHMGHRVCRRPSTATIKDYSRAITIDSRVHFSVETYLPQVAVRFQKEGYSSFSC